MTRGRNGEPEEKTSGVKATDVAREAGVLRRAYYRRLSEAHERGGLIAWTMLHSGQEILASFDVIGAYVENYGPVCASKSAGDTLCGVAEAEGFSADTCSYIRTGLGLAKMQYDLGGEPPPEAPYGGMGKPDMLIGIHNFCDGRFKWLQQASRYVDAPYYGLDLKDWPANWDEKDPHLKKHMISHYYEELKALVSFLENVTGKKLDKYRLSEYLGNSRKTSVLWRAALDLRTSHPCPLPAQDSLTICFPWLVASAYSETVAYYRRVYDEIEYRANNKISSMPEEKYRLLWYWIVPWYYLGIYEWLEKNFGATTICNAYGGGEILPPDDIFDYDFPLESIARQWYYGCYQPSAMHRRPSTYYRLQAKFAKECDIDGAMCMLIGSCRATADVYHAWHILKDTVPELPTLAIEADMVDTRTYSDALIKERITAFMGTVEAAAQRKWRQGLSDG